MKHTAMYDSFCFIDFSLSLEGFGFITLLPFKQIPSLNGLNFLGENEKIGSMRLKRAYEEKSDQECENADQRRMKKERTFPKVYLKAVPFEVCEAAIDGQIEL